MAVKVFAKDQPGSPPAAAHPDIAVTVVSPVAGHPNRMGMRAGRPATGRPNPVAAPFPAAWNPKPNVQRPGSGWHDFDLCRRRGLRLGHYDLSGRRCTRRRSGGDWLGGTFNNTAGEQRQADGNQKAFGYN